MATRVITVKLSVGYDASMAVWKESLGGETDWILKVVLGLSMAREGSHRGGAGAVPSRRIPWPVHNYLKGTLSAGPEAEIGSACHRPPPVPCLYWAAWNNIGPEHLLFHMGAGGLVFTSCPGGPYARTVSLQLASQRSQPAASKFDIPEPATSEPANQPSAKIAKVALNP
jgi:hypothetical protein